MALWPEFGTGKIKIITAGSMNTPTANDIGELAVTLFDSLIQPNPWHSFLKRLESYFNCRSCAVLLRPPSLNDCQLVISESLGFESPALIYEATLDSPLHDAVPNVVYILSKMFTEEEFKQKHPRFHAYHRRVGTSDTMTLKIVDDNTEMRLFFSIIRSTGEPLFEDKDQQALEGLIPLLNSACSLYAHLLRQKQELYIAQQAFCNLNVASISMDNGGRVMLLNPIADSILRSRGLFEVKDNRVQFVSKALQEDFEAALGKLGEPDCTQSEILLQTAATSAHQANLSILIRKEPLPEEFHDEHPYIVSLLIRENKRQTDVPAEVIEQALELTPAEAKLAQRLITGETLDEVSRSLNRSPYTVRTQLKSIFAKTGVRKQHQLITHIVQETSSYQW